MTVEITPPLSNAAGLHLHGHRRWRALIAAAGTGVLRHRPDEHLVNLCRQCR